MVRLASSIVLLSMGAAALYLGGWVVAVFMLAISLGGVFELLRVFQLHKSSLAVLTYIFALLSGYTAAEKGTGSAGYGIIPAFIADSVCI